MRIIEKNRDSRHLWILLWSLFLGGANIHLGGKEPVVLYFDLILILWLGYHFWNGFSLDLSDWILRLGIFCLLSQVISSIINYRDIYKSLAAMKILACGLLVYAIAKKIQPSLYTLILWGAVAGVLLLLNFERIRLGQYEGAAGLKDEVDIVLGRSNYVASMFLLLIPLSVVAAYIYKGKLRLLACLCGMLMVAGLIATMSRGAMLALPLGVFLSLPLMYRAGMRFKHLLPVLVIIGATIYLIPSELLQADAALIVYRFENPDQGRQELLAASWECFKQNPWFGVGPGQLGPAIATQMLVPDYDAQYMNAHNLVVNALAENGFFTGMVLLVMIGIVLRRAFIAAIANPNALNVGLWVALLCAVLHEMVEASFEGQQFQVLFWIIAAMLGARAIEADTSILQDRLSSQHFHL